MRGIWWVLKLMAGLVIVGCLLAFTLAVTFPTLIRAGAVQAWGACLLLSAALYWFANSRLEADAPRPRVSHWRGELYVLPAPLLRQAGVCAMFAGLSIGILAAFVHKGPLPGWEAMGVLLAALFSLWLCRASVLGLLNMRRAGYALKLDAAGIHFPGLPLLPWTDVEALELNPPRPDGDRSQCLVLQMRALPQQPSRLHALLRAALPGASIRHNSVSLPLPTLRDPAKLMDAAQSLWRRHRALQRP